MKPMMTFALLVMLLLATATTALASHGARLSESPVPAHGSVWFGSGLGRYDTVSVPGPVHGSVWFGSGLDRYDTLSVPVPVHGSVRFGEGLGH